MVGHLGEAKTLNRVREKFFWPGYANSGSGAGLALIVQQESLPTQKTTWCSSVCKNRLSWWLQILWDPYQQVRRVIVVSDYFTRSPNQEAATVAQKCIDSMSCRFSLPKQLHSDMGTQFESKVVKEMCRLLHIRKTHTTPYHPQGD